MGNTPESGSKGRNNNSSSYATNVDFTGIGLPSNFGGQHYELPPNFQKLNQNTEKARHSIEEKESKPQPKKRQNTAPNFSLQKEMEIDYQITLTDIKGLLNDHSTIDRRFYKQNFGAGSSLLLRYQRDLKLIADRNRILHTKAALSSKTLNEVMRHSHATHDDWMRLSKQLQNVTQIVDSLNQTKTRLKLILKKVEISQAILIEDTKAMLEIPFQKLKNEQTKQLDTIRNSNRLHLIAIANELEVERKASLDQKSAEQAKRSQKEEEVQRKRLQQRQKQLASKFEVQKENFEIYGAVTPLAGDDCPDVVHSRSDAKLEDITFEYKPSALDQFFSPVLPNKNESAANDTADAAELEFEQIDEPAPLAEGVNAIEEPEESKNVVLLEDEDEFV